MAANPAGPKKRSPTRLTPTQIHVTMNHQQRTRDEQMQTTIEHEGTKYTIEMDSSDDVTVRRHHSGIKEYVASGHWDRCDGQLRDIGCDDDLADVVELACFDIEDHDVVELACDIEDN